MSCEQCLDKLTDFIEGDLSPAEAAQVRSHLDACPDCARELARMEALVGAVRRLPDVEPPADLRERLRRVPEVTASAPVSWWSRSRRIAVTVTAAAAGLLLVWTGVLFYQQETGGVGDTMVAERSVVPPADTPAIDRPDADDAAEMAEDTAPPVDPMALQPDEDLSGQPVADTPEVVEAPPPVQPPPPTAESEPTPSAPAPALRSRSPRRTEPAPVAEQPTEPETREAPSMRAPAPEALSDRVPAVARESADSVRRAPDPDAPSEGVYAVPPAPRGPRGPSGPAGASGPPADAMVAEAEETGAEPRMMTVAPPAYLDAGEGASARIGEGTPFTVGITPPHEKITGTVVPATIRIETEADVARARVTVSGSKHLELVNIGDEGVVFEGPLEAGQQTVLSIRMLARRPGTQSITMRVRSSDPVVDTRLNVRMGDFAEPVPPAERPVQFNFVGTPIREAVAEITRQSGMSVIVDPGVGEATVTARAEDPVPAAAALRAVAEAAGLQVSEADGRSIVEGVDDEQ